MIWLLACAGSGHETGLSTVERSASVALSIGAPAVLDPELVAAELAVDVRVEGDAFEDCTLRVEARDQAGRARVLAETDPVWDEGLQLGFDGRDADDLPFDPGPVQLVGTLDCGELGSAVGTDMAYVLRLGLTSIDFGGDDVAPLAFHRTGAATEALTLLDELPEWSLGEGGLADLDADDGSPRALPAAWLDPAVPPWGAGEPDVRSLPYAVVAGGTTELDVTFGEQAVSAATGLVIPAEGERDGWAWLPEVHVTADGLAETHPWRPGQTVTFTVSEAAPTSLGSSTESLTWRFSVDGEELPGTLTTEHPRYVVVDLPTVPDGTGLGGSPAVAWIAALADVDEAVAGLEASDTVAIMDALREHLHHDPQLVYDPSDAAYTDYSGTYITWDWIGVDLGDWLDRNDGVELYCHSLACVYSSLGNHLGLPTEYVTLGIGFTTNLARAAGTESWQRYGFNSHGIVTVDGGATVWDAAVDFDGDDDPASSPVEPVSPMGWSIDDYLEALTPDPIGVVNGGRCYVF